jgi:hypothetical protein
MEPLAKAAPIANRKACPHPPDWKDNNSYEEPRITRIALLKTDCTP